MPEALIPGLDQVRTAGVVTLPGAFIGVLLGGGSPAQAAAAQVLVLMGIMAAQTDHGRRGRAADRRPPAPAAGPAPGAGRLAARLARRLARRLAVRRGPLGAAELLEHLAVARVELLFVERREQVGTPLSRAPQPLVRRQRAIAAWSPDSSTGGHARGRATAAGLV